MVRTNPWTTPPDEARRAERACSRTQGRIRGSRSRTRPEGPKGRATARTDEPADDAAGRGPKGRKGIAPPDEGGWGTRAISFRSSPRKGPPGPDRIVGHRACPGPGASPERPPSARMGIIAERLRTRSDSALSAFLPHPPGAGGKMRGCRRPRPPSSAGATPCRPLAGPRSRPIPRNRPNRVPGAPSE
jgi:hypothetical protein